MDGNNTERKSINLTKESGAGKPHVREAYPVYNNNTDQNTLERQEYRNSPVNPYQQPQGSTIYEDPLPARNNYGTGMAQYNQNQYPQPQFQNQNDDLSRYYNYEAPAREMPVQNVPVQTPVPPPAPQVTQPPVQMNVPMKFCKFCGEKIAADAVICTHCGRQVEEIRGMGSAVRSNPAPSQNIQQNFYNQFEIDSDKSKSTAVLLAAIGFFGIGGLHRFYVGKPLSGLLYFFTGGICGIGTLVDVISIASGTFKDGAGRIIKK